VLFGKEPIEFEPHREAAFFFEPHREAAFMPLKSN
jgi:hypothetical protein